MSDQDKTMMDPNPPGSRMKLGPYEAMEVLGRGGMAVVYKGIQQSLGRVVAIKVLPKEFSKDRQFVGRFHREAESVAKLNHPNIIQIIDKGEDGGTCYFVMEYVKGQSLSQRLQAKGTNFKELVAIGLQVCGALHYAHETGVVHRDIKPGNILIDDTTGIAKVADFGIAQLAEKSTAIGTLTGDHMAMGTLDYMAPEQKRDAKNVDRRADVYSVGVVLYEMATGRVPMGIFDPPSKINRELPKDFDAIVMKCLRDKPDERFQSCFELANELAALPQSPSTMVRMITSVKSAATSIGTEIGRKNPRYIGAALFLLAGLGLGVFGIYKYSVKAESSGNGGSSGSGPVAGTGTGTPTPIETQDPPPVDPEAAARRFRSELDRISKLGDAEAQAALEKLQESKELTSGQQGEVSDALARLEEKAAVAKWTARLEAVRHAAATQADHGKAAFDALMTEAKAGKAPESILELIRKEVDASQAAVAADVSKTKLEAYARAMEEAQRNIDEQKWREAEDQLAIARRNATDTAAVDALERKLNDRRRELATAEERLNAFNDALADGIDLTNQGNFSKARTKLARAKEFAEPGDQMKSVDAALKTLDEKESLESFQAKMREAKAYEDTGLLEEARKAYLEAVKIAPTSSLREDAQKKATAIAVRRDAEAKNREYEDAMALAKAARDEKRWTDVQKHAAAALRARPDDAVATALKKEADAALTKPPDPPPGEAPFTLKQARILPGKIDWPTTVAVSSSGRIFVVDAKYRRIHRFDAQGAVDGASAVDLAYPANADFDGKGRFWMSDQNGHVLALVDPETGKVERKFASAGTAPGQVHTPQAIAFGADHRMYVADYGAYRVQMFDPEAGTSSGSFGRVWKKVANTGGEFLYVASIAVDDEGAVYVGDRKLLNIQKFKADGTFDSFLVPSLGAQPMQLRFARGRIYCLEFDTGRVTVWSKSGKNLCTYGGLGRADGQLLSPLGMAVTPDGKVYVADTRNVRVVVLEESK